MTRLIGQRLVLRELDVADWPAVHAYSARPEVARYQTWGPNTPAESRAFVEQVLAAAQAAPRREYQLAITIADGGRLIGTGALWVRNVEHGQGELGYFLHPDHWGRGYATEAARLLLGFGFAELRLHRVFATCNPHNVVSARVLEKIGMTFEGRLRETLRLRAGWRDSAVYGVLAQECYCWRTSSRPPVTLR
jgi:RimJ/RimL family protein N-acetyltransferase